MILGDKSGGVRPPTTSSNKASMSGSSCSGDILRIQLAFNALAKLLRASLRQAFRAVFGNFPCHGNFFPAVLAAESHFQGQAGSRRQSLQTAAKMLEHRLAIIIARPSHPGLVK